MKDFSDDYGSHISESNYDRLIRTKEYCWCLWNDHGEKCAKSAAFITTTLATKSKQLPGGSHNSVIKGGYCLEHWRTIQELAVTGAKQNYGRPVNRDWRDELVDNEIQQRLYSPLDFRT